MDAGESGATLVDACHPGSSIERGRAALEQNESIKAQQARRAWPYETQRPQGQAPSPPSDSREALLYQASTACDTAAASQEANKY